MTVKGKKRQARRQNDLQILVCDAGDAVLLPAQGGEIRCHPEEVTKHLAATPILVCNAPLLGRRLDVVLPNVIDILELAAFVLPASELVPTAGGLARLLGLVEAAEEVESEARLLRLCLAELLDKVAQDNFWQKGNAAPILLDMELAGWGWASYLAPSPALQGVSAGWSDLPTWNERPALLGASDVRPDDDAVLERLDAALGPQPELRQGQREYAKAVAAIFGPARHKNAPNLAILEAGTGIGKTLAYLAPASLWAEQAKGTVWISTFTKNLQRQMDQELGAIYTGEGEKSRQTTIRKGRENYLCLLNLEEAINSARSGGAGRARIFLGLVRRWLQFTRDGDMVGGDFPRWLAYLFPGPALDGLSDRRGECIYAACAHYRQCFIERARRNATGSRIVIANHAVTLIEATLRKNDPVLPRHFIFDEGHHLFAAADSAFSLHLTGREGLELRGWLLGAEGRRRGRARGLAARLEDIASANPDTAQFLAAVRLAAQSLPARGFMRRVQNVQPTGPFETFLMHVRGHILATQASPHNRHGLEAAANEGLPPELQTEALRLARALADMVAPMKGLAKQLRIYLETGDDEAPLGDRVRTEAAVAAISQRASLILDGWIPILQVLGGASKVDPSQFEWLALDRHDGREFDVGAHRHWLDPTEPLAEAVIAPASGVCITSATLRDRVRIAEGEADWSAAETRVGAHHLPMAAIRKSFPSPFDYERQSRVLIVTDIKKDDPDAVAKAYYELFMASGGGAMGLFTAIERLRGAHQRIAVKLGEAGLPLYAQHVDPLDPGTLVDIFRAEPHTCLLGTDALRDGVDVPGEALRLVVFDRVPWPRPTLLHRARRQKFGGRAYDEMLVRLRLRQAFGRLIRRASDKGVFVLLDAATPSRLLEGLPAGTPVKRLGIEEAVAATAKLVNVKGPDRKRN